MDRRAIFILLISLLAIRSQELVFVQEIFRHGARSPYSIYWDGPEQMSLGQEITPTGLHQHYLLGRQLRKEYIQERNFLSEDYNWQEIYVRSTDVNRTISSANSQLLGLYPKGLNLPQNLKKEFRLPPFEGVTDDERLGDHALPFQLNNIPVHVVSPINDQVLLPYLFCESYSNYQTAFDIQHQEIANQFNANFSSTFQQLSEVFNYNFTDYTEIGGIYGLLNEVIVGDLYNGRPLPSNLTQELIDQVRFIDSFAWFFSNFGTDQGVDMLNTPLFNLFIDNFDKKLNNTYTDLKWYMLSAHDANLALVQRGLNISNYECLLEKYYTNQTTYLNCENRPGFASSIILELYNNTELSHINDTQYIKIRYNGKYMNLCEKQSHECSYTEFKQRILFQNVADFQLACDAQVQLKEEILQPLTLRTSSAGNLVAPEQNPLLFWVVAQSVVIALLIGFIFRKNQITMITGKQEGSYNLMTASNVSQI